LADDKSFTDLIIDLNTRKQLFDKGIDSTGRLLSDIGGDYSANTIEGTNQYEGKKQKGLPYDHITLYDTGDFYKSFKVFLDSNGMLTISADTIKDTTNLINDWGENILGLTEESLIVLRDKARTILIPYVKKTILTR
jgi:hypothetical protein